MHRSNGLISLVLLLTLFGTVACETVGNASAQVSSTPRPAARVVAATHLPSLALTQPLSSAQTLPIIPSSTATFTPVPAFTQTPQPTLPLEYLITNIRGHHQFFALGCEASAAKDWANYFGRDFNEFEFQYRLPLSDNPDYGFVGDVNGPWGQTPPYAYGVYAGPIADLLNSYGITAKAYKNYTLEQLKAKLAQGIPAIVWVIGNMVGGLPAHYIDKSGRTVIVAAYEHVVVVTGYSQDRIRYMNQGLFYEIPTDIFLNSWGVLGDMVVVDS